MTTAVRSHSYATLAAIAALAFIVACVGHEAFGHGGMCIALGGHVTLLSSIYFQCSNASPLTDAAGPLMNLALGAICWIVLCRWPSLSPNWRLFLVFAMAFNLFWGAGYFIFSAVTNTGDWAFVLRDLGLQPNWLWRCLMGAIGVVAYSRSIRLTALRLPSGTPLLVPYLVAGIVSCLAALCFDGPTLPALREAAQESFGASVGLLVLAYRTSTRSEPTSSIVFISYNTGWILTSTLATLAFVVTLGRGFTTGSHF